ncbi:MAG: hypothetical protein L0216_11820 [Planctomycetales bacterium]|nr:hypothetical protein [Planctomycetales bacterium]
MTLGDVERPERGLRRFRDAVARRRVGLLLTGGICLSLLGYWLPTFEGDPGTVHSWLWTDADYASKRWVLTGCAAGLWGAVLAPIVGAALVLYGERRVAWMLGAAGFLGMVALIVGHHPDPDLSGLGHRVHVGAWLLVAGNVCVMATAGATHVGEQLARGVAGRTTRLLLAIPLSAAILTTVWIRDPVGEALGRAASALVHWRPPGWRPLVGAIWWTGERVRSGLDADAGVGGVPWYVLREVESNPSPAAAGALLDALDRPHPEVDPRSWSARAAVAVHRCGVAPERLVADPRPAVASLGVEMTSWRPPADALAPERRRAILRLAARHPERRVRRAAAWAMSADPGAVLTDDLPGFFDLLEELQRPGEGSWSGASSHLRAPSALAALDGLSLQELAALLEDARPLVRGLAHQSLATRTLLSSSPGDLEGPRHCPDPPPPFDPEGSVETRESQMRAVRDWVARSLVAAPPEADPSGLSVPRR